MVLNMTNATRCCASASGSNGDIGFCGSIGSSGMGGMMGQGGGGAGMMGGGGMSGMMGGGMTGGNSDAQLFSDSLFKIEASEGEAAKSTSVTLQNIEVSLHRADTAST